MEKEGGFNANRFCVTMLLCYDVIMKTLITKEDVLHAREALLARGKQAGPRTIFNQLGRGSLTTVTKLLREIEADYPKPENQSELQDAFRKFWVIATDAGKEQAVAQIKELTETQIGLLEENDRLEAQLAAASERITELEKSQSGLTQELRNALESAEKARSASETHADKFADALGRIERLQDEHANAIKSQREDSDKALAATEERIQKLRSEYDAAHKRNHELEISLARAEAKLESLSQIRKTSTK